MTFSLEQDLHVYSCDMFIPGSFALICCLKDFESNAGIFITKCLILFLSVIPSIESIECSKKEVTEFVTLLSVCLFKNFAAASLSFSSLSFKYLKVTFFLVTGSLYGNSFFPRSIGSILNLFISKSDKSAVTLLVVSQLLHTSVYG